ncbi:MAG: divalent metal cation transporter [Verrucomicrobiota bacterium]
MSDQQQYQRELQAITSVADAPPRKKFLTYARLSGPGWLQGAITLGGGSLAGALFLGSTSGFGGLWIQPLAMICGIIMLSAIAYVTLSTGHRPFHAINRHLHPLLGWSWLIATIMANLVWTMPQFALATGAIQQNLGLLPGPGGQTTIIVLLLAIGLGVNWLYESGGQGAKTFDLIIKLMVAVIVLSFFAVVIALLTSGQLPLAKIFTGYLPNPLALFKPADTYLPLIEQSNFPDYWRDKITDQQRDVTFAAFGTAVGINMTFLLPYTLLKKRWGQKHRGLSITDLSIGLFIPFFLATSCVVIASASSFHGKATLPEGESLQAAIASLSAQIPNSEGQVGNVDLQLAQMLQKRDAGALAVTLEPFAGETIAQNIFGIGVLGMALSTIIILMLMNGLAFQEAFSREGSVGVPPASTENPTQPNLNNNKALYFLGCSLSGLSGACFPLLWTGTSKAALAVPTSVIGGSLIPIAYFTFLLMMNSKKILGDARPEGKARLIWNTLMIFATTVATAGSIWVLEGKTHAPGWMGQVAWGGLIFLAILFLIGILSFKKNER